MGDGLVKVSKFLSLILRHQPEAIGITLDENGWAEIDVLIDLANKKGKRLNRAMLDRIVSDNDKQRFAISEDGRRIRASQGHSVEIDLALPASEPPALLFHGTASRFIESIRAGGLHSGNRQHVHLSLDIQTATKVGQRHGKPVILVVRSQDMSKAGHQFFLSANGVWLTERVPIEFIDFPAG
jgi:putative RNA 2'-phosphotransferase